MEKEKTRIWISGRLHGITDSWFKNATVEFVENIVETTVLTGKLLKNVWFKHLRLEDYRISIGQPKWMYLPAKGIPSTQESTARR
jgi:hypothetical protein